MFERDGTSEAVCRGCIDRVIVLAAELLTTAEQYEGRPSKAWLAYHRRPGHERVGCPWCSAGAA